MRAAVMRGTKLVVDDVPEPIPHEGEVLVKTLACGICGSDLHALKHRDLFFQNSSGLGSALDPSRDLVMGHEFCAEILDYGPNTEKHHPVGTRVCSFPMLVRSQQPTSVGYSNEVPGGYGEKMVLMEAVLLPIVRVARNRFRGVVDAMSRAGGPANPGAASRAMTPRLAAAVRHERHRIGDLTDRSTGDDQPST